MDQHLLIQTSTPSSSAGDLTMNPDDDIQAPDPRAGLAFLQETFEASPPSSYALNNQARMHDSMQGSNIFRNDNLDLEDGDTLGRGGNRFLLGREVSIILEIKLPLMTCFCILR